MAMADCIETLAPSFHFDTAAWDTPQALARASWVPVISIAFSMAFILYIYNSDCSKSTLTVVCVLKHRLYSDVYEHERKNTEKA